MNTPTNHPIRPLSSRIAYENPWTRVREDEIEFPDGTTGIYGVVEKPDYAIVVAYPDPDHVLLVRQYRYTIKEWTLEFPQGYVAGASPEEMAGTELVEETGFSAANLRRIGRYHQSTGLSNQVANVFEATDLTEVGTSLEDSEVAAGLTHLVVSLDELERLIRSGEITDVSTIASWYLARG